MAIILVSQFRFSELLNATFLILMLLQEDILSEVSKAESDAGAYLDQFSRLVLFKCLTYLHIVELHG